ncbi:MAG: glycosyltransferase family 39 protein [Bacteroidia bacterium]|nr:glycosyltransferase family 39 protein [Bacteroidia bacterium]
MKLQSQHILPVLLLILAFILRWFHFDDWSLTNDELSAWLRLQYPTFGELLEKGVRPDFHPAGLQSFLYFWTHVFGDSPFALRFPFLIVGTLGVWLTFLVGKKWFGTNAGLMAATAIAILQLPLMYAQIARPYAPGMFFALGMAYCWTKILFDEKINWWWAAGLALFTALNLYNHYFSGMFAALLGLAGFLFLNKNNFKPYLIGGALGVVLFLPHTGITLEQLSRGGLDSWLGPPEPNFLLRFLYNSAYDSTFFAVTLIALVILPLGIPAIRKKTSKLHAVCLGLFAVTFLTGYYYSTLVNPVLQYSVLLFTFPFLTMFLFSFWGEGNLRTQVISVTLLVATGLFTLINENFYQTERFGVFRELVVESHTNKSTSENEKTTIFFNAIAPEYIQYYYDRLGYKKDYLFHRGDDTEFLTAMQKAVHESRDSLFIYGWTNNRNPQAVFAVIRSKFPELIRQQDFFNSGIYVFGRRSVCHRQDISLLPPPRPLNPHEPFLPHYPEDDLYLIHPEQEFAEFTELNLDSACRLCPKLLVNLEYQEPEIPGEVVLVAEIRRGDSLLLWTGAPSVENKYRDSLGIRRLSLIVANDSSITSSDRLKIYLWNKEKLLIQPVQLRLEGLNDRYK